MASCRACGVPITWGLVIATGERIPVEDSPRYRGPDRYRIEGFAEDEATPLRVGRVAPDADVQGHVDHRTVCPANQERR